jgi:hypothetical protein
MECGENTTIPSLQCSAFAPRDLQKTLKTKPPLGKRKDGFFVTLAHELKLKTKQMKILGEISAIQTITQGSGIRELARRYYFL